MDELKACPFCGKSELHTNREGRIRCVNDECFQNQFIAEYAWQTRPLEDALQQRVGELEKLSNAHKKLACLVDQQQLDLRTSISKAVEEIENLQMYGKLPMSMCDGIDKALAILRKHGLVEDK